MYAPRVFVSIISVLIVFAVSSYVMTGSFYTAFIQTAVCAVLLQVGYFVGILYLVRQQKKMNEAMAPEAKPAKDNSRRDNLRADATPNLPTRDA